VHRPGGPILGAVILTSLTLSRAKSADDMAFPDFDLRIECPARVSGEPRSTVRFPARVVLHTSPQDSSPSSGVRAWSLSVKASGSAAIVEATTDGTDIPAVFRPDGYEKTELTHGPDNEGAVSAVVLSISQDVYLPPEGDVALLNLVLEARLLQSGCAAAGVDFVDGLVGSGQPVKNVITCGEAFTRKDDGGPLDNDADGYEVCAAVCCARVPFIRGDANSDAHVDLGDSLRLLGFLFRSGISPDCAEAGDANSDDVLDLADVVYTLNHLFLGGDPPSAPYPGCGASDGERVLSCDESPACR